MTGLRLTLFCLLVPFLSRADQTLIDFQTLTPSVLSRSWPKDGGRQQPLITEHGALFSLQFHSDDKRILSDANGSWDLRTESCIRFELEVSQPRHLLETTLYLKSGSGWYSHSFTLDGPGRHVFNFPLSDFKPEGTPSGWAAISTIRFAFWPREAGKTVIRPLHLQALTPRLLLLDGASASPASERYLCGVTLKRMQQLLNNTGVPYGKAQAADLSKSIQRDHSRILLLPYLPSPNATLLQTLDSFLRDGGKLIVYQSKSTTLAARMGVSLGEPLTSTSVGRFDHLQFPSSGTAGFPTRVYQHAWSVPRITAASPSSRILARWAAQDGTLLQLPGVIQSSNGFWFSHVWRSADTAGKTQALTAMLGTLDASNWQWAARTLYQRVHPRSFQVKHGVFPRDHKPSSRMREVADQFYQRGQTAMNLRDYRNAWKQFSRVEPLMVRALASSRARWMPPIRGIWDQQGTGFSAGNWTATCRSLKAAGFNAVFSYVGSAGRANYPSKLIPGSVTLKRHGDQVAQFSRAAANAGLQRHLWKICWKLNSSDPAFTARMKREGRLMQDASGNTLPWLSPSDPRNVHHEVQGILELLRNYPVEGIHLDYMRYPGLEADFSPIARKAFQARYGQVTRWPSDVVSGPRARQFNAFKQGQLHAAMEQIHDAVKAEFPKVTLSVAVWGAYPDCAASKSQDWPVWLQRGWADLLIPMNYTENPYQFEGWLDSQLALPGCRGKLVPGLGLISSSGELDPASLLQQMDISRQKQTPGVVLYRLDSSLPDRLFPMLEAGVWKQNGR